MEQRTCKEDVKEVASAERIARVTQIVYEKHAIPNNRAGRPRRVTCDFAGADSAVSQSFQRGSGTFLASHRAKARRLGRSPLF